MEFVIKEFAGGSFVRQKAAARIASEKEVNILKADRVLAKEMPLDKLIAGVKDHFTKHAPRNAKQGLIYVLRGTYTFGVVAMVGPLLAPVEVLSDVSYMGPDHSTVKLELLPPEIAKITFKAIYDTAGKTLGLTPETLITVDDEDIKIKQYLGLTA